MAQRFITVSLKGSEDLREALRRVAVEEKVHVGEIVTEALETSKYGEKIRKELDILSAKSATQKQQIKYSRKVKAATP